MAVIARSLMASLALAMLLALAVPAFAGSADDPQMTDDCGVASLDGQEDTYHPATPWTDVCAAWMDVTGTALTVGLDLAADITERPHNGFYMVWWTTEDGCRHRVFMGDGNMVGDISIAGVSRDVPDRSQSYGVDCDAPVGCSSVSCYAGSEDLRVDLDDDAITEDGSTITWTVDLADDELRSVAALYEAGDTMTQFTANTAVEAEVAIVYSDTTTAQGEYTVPEGSGTGG